ncbi:MAG: patatin family protein [Oscillospiraceae bacterium]|nr:patatin family protein [Oscillospiraceae bacterium]
MQQKTGLVLEGGAMRGMYTAGILDVLMEHHVVLDGAIGVSAGAAFGCNYKSRQIGRSIRYNLKYCKNKHYCSVYSLIRTGDLYGGEFCYHKLPTELDLFDVPTYTANPMPFYVVATDVESGKPVYHRADRADDTDMEWFRASASMPLVSNIVQIGDKHLLDGGMSDPIPLAYFQSLGYSRNVVILTQPRGYRKTENKSLPLLRVMLRKYPNAVKVMANRHLVYNRTTQFVLDSEQAGDTFVFAPKESLPIKRICRDPELLQQTYDIGRKQALELLPDLLRFLGKEEKA